MKLKYRKRTIFVHKDEPVAHFIEILNRKGAEGWETIAAWADELGNYVRMKKQLAV
jgi:hypothetical protein